ncbi:putative nucleotidyltransferase with HDIG domain [Caldicoprobacter guelmensis]|uniref:HD-GYP domain-containing protein n=1 Tax=Caldicoprobacter guelmensis TaxID=1170224 RepID=UPI00195D7A75|nr:HD-GYP domain-containing protein [Caldicoprobacter guelmensis]MBM7582759.1 putative nucleotidyltransferase with HDIG domain [Caldicoprobacter guelmensis]
MNKKAILFLSIVSIVGVFIISISIYNMPKIQTYELVLWILLAGMSQSFLVLFMQNGVLSVVFAIILAAHLYQGTYFAVVVAANSVLFQFYHPRKGVYEHVFNRPFYKTLFNMSNLAISAYISGSAYQAMHNRLQASGNLYLYMLCLITYITLFLLFNSSILMLLMKFLTQQPFFKLWKKNILWAIPNFYALAPFGYFIYLLYQIPNGHIYVILLFGPLLLARYSFQLYLESQKRYYQIIQTLTAAIEAKDKYTEGHSKRVEMYAEKIARKLKLPPSKIEAIKVAALLHDIGKIGIEDSILRKPHSLSLEEWEKIKQHPDIGVKILEDVDFLDDVKNLIKNHHERYDGNGYPQGSKGEEIPIEAYIIAAADAYDALTSDRPYRKAFTPQEALEIIRQNKGTQFHPVVVDALISVVQEKG